MTADRPGRSRAPATTEHDVIGLLHELHGASQVFRARAEENAAQGGGSFARTQVLASLGDSPQVVPAVARRLSLTRQSVQTVMDRLLESGLVERVPNPAHRASSMFRITDTGAAHLEAVRQRAAPMYEAVEDAFGHDEIERLAAALRRLRDLGLSTPRAGDPLMRDD